MQEMSMNYFSLLFVKKALSTATKKLFNFGDINHGKT